jgi:hypothetical protein
MPRRARSAQPPIPERIKIAGEWIAPAHRTTCADRTTLTPCAVRTRMPIALSPENSTRSTNALPTISRLERARTGSRYARLKVPAQLGVSAAATKRNPRSPRNFRWSTARQESPRNYFSKIACANRRHRCSIEGENIQSQCIIVDIQIIGRKPHASTGLDGWIGFKNKAIREGSDLPHHSSLPSI